MAETLSPYLEGRRTFVGRSAIMPDVVSPLTSGGLEQATAQIEQRTKTFQDTYLANHPGKAGDPKIKSLFDDMNSAGFWHVLGRIDGRVPFEILTKQKEEELAQDAKKAREWAGSNFSIEELTEILGISVDTALSGTYSDRAQPGFSRGHAIIYSHLAEKPDSLFAGMASKPLLKRLQNGRLWEEITELGRYKDRHSLIVSDVLTNHFDDLDPNFFEQGYAIFQRNQGEVLERGASLESLSTAAVARYFQFVEKMDERLALQRKQKTEREAQEWMGRRLFPLQEPDPIDPKIAYLLVPYIHDIHSPNPNRPITNSGSLSTRLNNPLVQTYLEHSKTVRADVAKDLLNYAINNPDDDDISKDVVYAARILTLIPKPRAILDQMVSMARTEPYPEGQLKGVNQLFRLSGMTLSDYLSGDDSKLKAKA